MNQPLAGRFAILADAGDNVATLMDDRTGLDRLASGGPVAPGIPFGHKVAVAPIAAGAAVIKYGHVIGHATADIPQGGHVHVHNCD